ncbi:MAG: AAA family ATPase [Blastocatellia bacterium]|nr:AAA family ATPase [Blastocatellia bacterium]
MENTDSTEGILSAQEFASELNITKKTLFQYEREGKLPPAKRHKRGKIDYRYYSAEDLVEARKRLNLSTPFPALRRKQLFMNLKGGVGKSVLSYNYAYAMAKRGLQTLVIDLDAQAHLTTYAGLQPEKSKFTLYHVLFEQVPIELAIVPTKLSTLHIIPSNLNLSPLELSLFGMHAREYRLQRALASLQEKYQIVVIDAPPNLSLLNVNAILSVQDLIVPVMADFFSYDGLKLLFESLAQFERDLQYSLENIFVVLNNYNAAEVVCQQSRRALETHYLDYLLKSVIRKSTAFPKSTSVQKSVFELDPKSKAALDIAALTDEILSHFTKTGHEAQSVAGRKR